MKNSSLTLYDSMARKKRVFVPSDKKRITMYVCGPTVYNYAHIGNLRAAVIFDILFRVLRYHYGTEAVVYARNITDIDNKIITAAQKTGESIEAITLKYSAVYREETARFNVLPPTIEPIATSYINEMIALAEQLITNGFAYVAKGHVLFDIERFDHYGSLSGINRKDMLIGARVEIAPYKKNPIDFVLWKPSEVNEPGWDSPWGRGRPGWHLECSTMIKKELGQIIDIHGGGQDLRFPHHENEIAQSVCANSGVKLANYWVHNGLVLMDQNKMSKSLGNIVLGRDLLKRWHGEVLRFALLSVHYRKPLELSDKLFAQSKQQLDRFYRLIGEDSDNVTTEIPQGIIAALNDDLNTPMAIAGLHELYNVAMKTNNETRTHAITSLKAAGKLLGLFSENSEQWFKIGPTGNLSVKEIESLIDKRTAARKKNDFATADRIRETLAADDILIEDKSGETTWRRR